MEVISSFGLKIIAMIFMTFDHLWGSGILSADWLTWVGRVAFPIFAFMIVEGFFYTKDLKKYMARLFIFALISEIPYNLLMESSIIFPFNQNVLWTFLIGLIGISAIDESRRKFKEDDFETSVIRNFFLGLRCAGFVLLSYFCASILFTDYKGTGILMMFVFYFFHGKGWINNFCQLIGMIWINCVLLKGLFIPISIGGITFEVKQQSFAVLALLPIWMYNGKKCYKEKLLNGKFMQYFFYTYYPLHMVILYVLNQIIN